MFPRIVEIEMARVSSFPGMETIVSIFSSIVSSFSICPYYVEVLEDKIFIRFKPRFGKN